MPAREHPTSDVAEAVHMAALDDLLEALELVARRPDVIAVMREREVAGENRVCKVFGESPVAPGDGPLTCLTLKAGPPAAAPFVEKKRAEPSRNAAVDPDHVPTAAELGAAIERALRPMSSQIRPASAQGSVARLLARLWGMTRRCLP